MIIRLTNTQGAVSFNGILIDQIIERAMKPWEGRVWIANYKGRSSDKTVRSGNLEPLEEKIISTTENGVFIRLYLMLRFGTSIKACTESIISSVAKDITECLDLPIEDIELVVTGLISEKPAKRDIVVSYSMLTEAEDAPLW
ncbi:MAG: Asp23/Gls24 family envelope stress response protein [Firmicutes bacterium]|nr:Asp23/Gls24 family envelope stress response protein [Bacillota bacterium]